MATETIDFISKTGWIEESAGRRKFQIGMEAEIRDYEKKMLCCGECLYAMPMHFISEGQIVKAFYDYTGYMQIREYINRKMQHCASARENQKVIADVLLILSGILECIKGMENYLIFPERIAVHPDVVFIDLNTDRIALAFYPNESPELTLQSRITKLIHDLSGLFRSEEADRYLRKFEDFIVTKNPGLDGMISFLGSMQREVSYIYWDSKNFRRIEEQATLSDHDQAEKKEKGYARHLKSAAFLVFTAVGLAAVFLSGKLSMINFAGLVIITGAIDLLILRKQRII